MKHTPITFYRDAKNGQRVTEATANRRPATTVKETVYRPSPKKG